MHHWIFLSALRFIASSIALLMNAVALSFMEAACSWTIVRLSAVMRTFTSTNLSMYFWLARLRASVRPVYVLFFAIHLFALRFTFNKCIDLYYHICKHEANLIKNYRIENFIEYTDGAGPLTKMDTDFTLNSWIASNCLKMEH